MTPGAGWTRAFVAAGSNLGDREAAIAGAVEALEARSGIDRLRISPLHETAPVGPPGQGLFLNAVIELRTRLAPRELLEACLDIERRFGRDRRQAPRWGPRTLDLDLLLYGDAVLDEPGLVVPHPRMHERLFVLDPLADLDETVRHPVLDATVAELRRRLRGPERDLEGPPT